MRIGSSIFLIALGAILAFAMTIDPTPMGGLVVEWNVVGVILMLVGAAGVLWSIMVMNAWRERDLARERDRDIVDVAERDRIVGR